MTKFSFNFVQDLPQAMPFVQAIFREYANSLEIDLCFQGFEEELANLPKPYNWPNGCIVLAFDEAENIAASIALKPLKEEGVCEMKRLYVRPAYRGMGVARALVRQLIGTAREKGYQKMKLDTLSTMTEAIALYRSEGFVETDQYVHNPQETALFFELILTEQ